MPLVHPVEDINDPKLQELIEFYNETLGFCPNSVLTMYHRPAIALAFIELNKSVMECKGRLTSALKRFIGYVSSNASGCSYCQAHTIRAAERFGANSDQLGNIWEYNSHDSFSEAERAALDFAIAATIVPNEVNEEIRNNLKRYWSDGEIVEMLGVISLFGYLNRWNDSMGTTLEAPAVESGNILLAERGWSVGKHK